MTSAIVRYCYNREEASTKICESNFSAFVPLLQVALDMEAQRDKFVSHSEVPVLCVSWKWCVSCWLQAAACPLPRYWARRDRSRVFLLCFPHSVRHQAFSLHAPTATNCSCREMHSWEASFVADAKAEYVTSVKSASQDCILPDLWIAYCLYILLLILYKCH